MKSELRKFIRGFRYAGQGIAAALQQERNLRFHVCAAAYVLAFSRFYHFTAVEYALLAVCIAGVISLELVNSAIERAVDRPDAAHWAAAGAAKDMAAGAVLAGSLGAVAVGLLLFGNPSVVRQIVQLYLAQPWRMAVLLASLAAAYGFVFRWPGKQ